MRKIIVAGNWKMNLNFDEAKLLYLSILEGVTNPSRLDKVLIFPPFPYLYPLSEIGRKDFIFIGSQNCSSEKSGAHTGEVSAGMIKSLGVNYTLVGHSERRSLYGESNEVLKSKINLSLENGLSPIFCCGELLEERQSNQHEKVIESQLEESLFHLSVAQMKEVTIAYEPVWAIGTGVTASTEQAEEMHAFIRKLLRSKYNDEIADNTSILYGGSCNAGNAKELFSCENVDGGLIGGASLKQEEFLKIIASLDE